MLVEALKNLLKKYFYIFKVWDRLSPAVQISQVTQMFYFRDRKRNGTLPDFRDTGFKVFSQFEEDGKLLFIFSVIGMGSRTFVDLGSHDGVNSNCANLALHFSWRGLFVDGDKTVIDRGRRFYSKYPERWSHKPKFLHSFITTENVNEIIRQQGISGEIDLLSIDIDGNDYWIWKALDVIDPKVVVIECQVAFGHHNAVVPYEEKMTNDVTEDNLYGASASALAQLAAAKGYRLVGSNEYGNNLFFIKNGIADNEIPEVTALSTLTHPFATEKFLPSDAVTKFMQA
jgi:hypothetical protein